MPSVTMARRASLISRRSAGFFSGSKQSSPLPSQLTQSGDLLLLLHLPVDIGLDIRMIGVDHHHLGGAARGAAGLDRAGGAVADLEEAHQP
jgi:hypothetical protein